MKKKVLIVLLLISSLNSFSQQVDMPDGLDGGKYSKKKTSNDKDKKSAELEPEFDNFISYSIGHFTRGIAAISYERVINYRFSAKATLGFCYSEDRMHTAIVEFGDDKLGVDSLLTLKKALGSSTFKMLPSNLYFELGGKVYTNTFEDISFYNNNTFLYRFYGGLSYRNYQGAYVLDIANSSSTASSFKVNNSAISMNFGMTTANENGVTTEYYIGLGRMTSRYPAYKLDANNYSYTLTNKKTNESSLMPLLGINIGFSF